MLQNIQNELKIQWENFNIVSEWDAKFVDRTFARKASDKIIPIILSQSRYRIAKYLDKDGIYKIGYGYGDPENIKGLTEVEAYAYWIEQLKVKEKQLRNQLSVPLISQSQFDAILSLYFLTGNWRTIEGNTQNYDLSYAINTSNWELAANMLSDAKSNSDQRKKEAKIMMLADYRTEKTRNWLRFEGIQYERNRYIRGVSDTITKTQLQIGYYRQTKSFLPGMSDLEKRKTVLKSQ